MKTPTTRALKIFALFALLGSVVVFALVFAKPEIISKKLDDVIKHDKVLSSEKPENFIALMAADTESGLVNESYVTVYNQNLALVKEGRELDLAQGYNQVKYQDVPSQINPSSVIFSDTKYEDTEVIEQTYEFDLVSQQKLLEKYIDEEIKVFSNVEDGVKEYRGKLLSYLDGIMLETGGGIVSIKDIQSIEFSKLPEGLITKPTLVWSVFASQAGKRNVLTTYLTGGLTWQADYIAYVNADDTLVDLKGWTTINNTSGASYPNATLKLVAGDVNIIQPVVQKSYYEDYAMPAMVAESTAGGYSEESFFEYHLYTLGRKTNLKDNEQKQISLLNAKDISVKKEFVYDSNKAWDKIRVMLGTKNSEDKGLGIPLPKGVVRVYKQDSEGHLQFIGEDQIDHTPKDEEIEVFLGNAFDISVEKTTQESSRSGGLLNIGGRCEYQDIEINIRNHKQEAIEVKVMENYWGPSVEILDSNYKFEKEDEYTYTFRVPVEADGENTLKYTVKQCW
ncbi:DUF4139 domain-containing protein [bacterium]|nr:DUF4139 domain-containing protein [bacterium]